MVSVCMATYNGSKYITAQINSVLCQLNSDDELIISDDGSDDDTLAIIKTFTDQRIKLYTNGSKRNLIQNFGYAISKAKGNFIFLCDQDDVWHGNKVAECIKLLSDYDLVISDCTIVDSELSVTDDSYFTSLNAGPGLIKNFRKNTFLGCCMCFKNSLLPLLLPFPEKIPMHDIWIGFVATIFGKVKFENQQLMMYRRHSKTVTNQRIGYSTNSLFGKISNRINILRYVPLLIKRRMKV